MTLNKKIILGIFVLAFFVMSAVPVCGQSDFGSPGISASPSVVNPGDEITVTYSGAPGFIWDWVAIYEVGDPNEWFGESCYLYGESSGSLIFTAPDEPGDYEFRLLENDGYDDIARSNVVRVQEETTETPPPTDIAPPQSADQATLRWMGMAEDKVGKGNQPNPDGDLDGHFSLTLIPNGEKTVDKITLLSADGSGNHVGGQVWDTAPNYYWILGVEQPSGVKLNPTDKDISKRITTTVTFKLYAANSGWFKAGQHFKVKVDFTDGTSIEAVTAVTAVTAVAETPQTHTAEATLRWMGMAEDKVGKGNQPNPDGDLDGHFSLTLIPKGEKTVDKIALLSADGSGNHVGGQVWDTAPNYYWILGVEQSSGVKLNPTDKDISKRITTTATFELYAANSGWFKAGQHFMVKVDFNDGTSIEAVTAVTETPQTPTAEATLRWMGMAEDKVGKGNQPNPDGDLDGHFSLTLIPKGEKTVDKIALLSADGSGNHVGGQVWDTAPNYYWILGVEQPSGVKLNPTDKDISKRITTTATFELYAANSGWFKAGQHFMVKVDFNDGTSIEAVTAVTETPPPLSPPEISALIFESRSKSSGSTVQIPLTLKGVRGDIGNMDITLRYDPSVLEATRVIKGGLTANSVFDYNIPGKGTIKISLSMAGREGFSGDGSIAYIVFDVIGSEGSNSRLEIASLSANRATDMAPMDIPTQDGVFLVPGVEECRGDCDGDGEITPVDALCALRMAVEKIPEDLVMDVNGDGKVSSLDAREILRKAVATGLEEPDFEKILDEIESELEGYSIGELETFDTDYDGTDDKWTYTFNREEIEEGLFEEKVLDFEAIDSGTMQGTVTITLENRGDRDYEDYEYILEIPKSFAASVDDLEFSVPPDRVINPDPATAHKVNSKKGSVNTITARVTDPSELITTIISDYKMLKCESKRTQRERDFCFGKLALERNMPSLCDKIGDSKGMWDFYNRDLIYGVLAKKNKNPLLCDKIGNALLKQLCIKSAKDKTKKPAPPPAPAPTPSTPTLTPTPTSTRTCGDYGQECCPDASGKKTICYEGECQNGMCIHCGAWGEPCCYEKNPEGDCTDFGYDPPAYCKNGYCYHESYDCGHVGYKPCEHDGRKYCYDGVLDKNENICRACGDYEQPCCQYTDYPCDYGECRTPDGKKKVGYPYVGGICKRVDATATPTPTPGKEGTVYDIENWFTDANMPAVSSRFKAVLPKDFKDKDGCTYNDNLHRTWCSFYTMREYPHPHSKGVADIEWGVRVNIIPHSTDAKARKDFHLRYARGDTSIGADRVVKGPYLTTHFGDIKTYSQEGVLLYKNCIFDINVGCAPTNDGCESAADALEAVAKKIVDEKRSLTK